MGSLIRGEPDVVIRWAGPLILFGFLLGFASVRFGLPGVITATFAIGLGASGGVLNRWRHEQGLWMVAGLFLVMNATIYGLFLYGKVGDIVGGGPGPDAGTMIDVCLGTMLLSSTLRFLWSVTKYNWSFSRESRSSQHGKQEHTSECNEKWERDL